jgi:hypothetical protein
MVVVKIDVTGYHNLAGLLILFGSSIGFRGEEDKPTENPEKLSDIMDCLEQSFSNFFQVGTTLLVRMFCRPPYSCPL